MADPCRGVRAGVKLTPDELVQCRGGARRMAPNVASCPDKDAPQARGNGLLIAQGVVVRPFVRDGVGKSDEMDALVANARRIGETAVPLAPFPDALDDPGVGRAIFPSSIPPASDSAHSWSARRMAHLVFVSAAKPAGSMLDTSISAARRDSTCATMWAAVPFPE